ncbi:MAG: SHOCT domain-containing protein [Candidatus Nanopelagicales bacterium]|nr:SHOCT domain-containing protein [Candidatus Nanopelagicales bacterium]
MAYRFNPPPGWQVEEGFAPGNDWRPDPAWPAAPQGWEFWVAVPDAPPPPPPGPQQSDHAPPTPPASGGATASAKMGGMFKSLKARAQDEDWIGKARTAATQATATAQQAAGQATAQAKQRDQAALDKAGPLPEGAVWRGISHDAGRNSIVTLYPDRIERTKPTSRMSLTGMLAGGPEDVEVIPMKSVSSVQARRGAWYHDVTVFASGNTIVFSVDAADAERLRGLIMDQVLGGSGRSAPPAAAPATPAEAPATSGDALIEQIRKLGELRDAGILTPEEFESKKADLLGRL